MSSLLAALGSSGNALDVLQQALDVIQNNVSNASTPGYASQQLNITAQALDVASGAAGGIAAQGLISSRDSYADTQVQQQLQTLGLYTAQAQSTGNIQSFFDQCAGRYPGRVYGFTTATFCRQRNEPLFSDAGRFV